MNILEQICEDKKTHIEKRKAACPLSDLKAQLADTERAAPRFIESIKNDPQISLIAEIKKASPSAGVIRADFDPASLAVKYQNAGASCLSVLTDEPYFQGHDDYIAAVKAACPLPALRKDFIIDAYQVYETKALGADCLLLIMAALSDDQAGEFYNIAKEIGLDVLFEVHDDGELSRTLRLSPKMMGINSRNLKTLEVNLQRALDMAQNLPADIVRVAESGIKTPEDVALLTHAGFDAMLVGESLMKQDDLESATKTLLRRA